MDYVQEPEVQEDEILIHVIHDSNPMFPLIKQSRY